MTERDLDRLIYESVDQLPPEEITDCLPDPWRRPMRRVCWGVALNTITLNFWYLDCIFPAVGVVLLWLGFPEDILTDLSDEDAALLEGAWQVETEKNSAFYDGVTEQGSSGFVHVRLDSYDGYGCAILYWFDWETPPNQRGMEGLEIIPAQTVGAFCAVPPVGRMLWEEDGAAYAQPLEFRYGTTQYDGFEALVFGMGDHGTYYTDFSLPAKGEHIRGYALWVVRPDAAQETWFNYTCDYVRRKDLFSYPYQLPSEYARTVGLNHGGYNIFFGLGLSPCVVYDGGQEGHLIAP